MRSLMLALTITTAALATGGVAHAERFDSRGWVLLGEAKVDSRGRQVIDVEHRGRFERLTVSSSGADVKIRDLKVTFSSGRSFSPDLADPIVQEGTATG